MTPVIPCTPRVRCIVNQTDILVPINVVVSHTNTGSAGRFSLIFALNQRPPAYWVTIGRAYIAIQFSCDGGLSYCDIMEGDADAMRLDPVAGTAAIVGRDLTALLLNQRASASYQNKSSSEIVSDIANSHGINADVTLTVETAGRYYSGDRVIAPLAQGALLHSEWDVIAALALHENFDAYVQGRTVFFHPADRRAALVVNLTPGEVISLAYECVLPRGESRNIEVSSWNSALGRTVTGQPPGTVPEPLVSSLDAITVIRPNLWPDDAEALGRRLRRSLESRSATVTLDMQADLQMGAGQSLRFPGWAILGDQTFVIQSITRKFRQGSGLTQKIRAVLRPSDNSGNP